MQVKKQRRQESQQPGQMQTVTYVPQHRGKKLTWPKLYTDLCPLSKKSNRAVLYSHRLNVYYKVFKNLALKYTIMQPSHKAWLHLPKKTERLKQAKKTIINMSQAANPIISEDTQFCANLLPQVKTLQKNVFNVLENCCTLSKNSLLFKITSGIEYAKLKGVDVKCNEEARNTIASLFLLNSMLLKCIERQLSQVFFSAAEQVIYLALLETFHHNFENYLKILKDKVIESLRPYTSENQGSASARVSDLTGTLLNINSNNDTEQVASTSQSSSTLIDYQELLSNMPPLLDHSSMAYHNAAPSRDRSPSPIPLLEEPDLRYMTF